MNTIRKNEIDPARHVVVDQEVYEELREALAHTLKCYVPTEICEACQYAAAVLEAAAFR